MLIQSMNPLYTYPDGVILRTIATQAGPPNIASHLPESNLAQSPWLVGSTATVGLSLADSRRWTVEPPNEHYDDIILSD